MAWLWKGAWGCVVVGLERIRCVCRGLDAEAVKVRGGMREGWIGEVWWRAGCFRAEKEMRGTHWWRGASLEQSFVAGNWGGGGEGKGVNGGDVEYCRGRRGRGAGGMALAKNGGVDKAAGTRMSPAVLRGGGGGGIEGCRVVSALDMRTRSGGGLRRATYLWPTA